MRRKLTDEECEQFCGEFLRSFDPDRAAGRLGRGDGLALLRRPEIRERLREMRAAVLPTREDVLRQLGALALARGEEPAMKPDEQMKALELLWKLLDEEDSGVKVEALLRSLAKAEET